MNSDEIYAAIEKIAATSSKNDKIALLKVNVGNVQFRETLRMTYNPFKVYGIRQLPQRTDNGTGVFTSGTWLLLDALAERELSGNAARDEVQKELNRLSQDSATLLGRILLKDLRAGFSESSCNKAKAGLIPEFPYMRCSLPNKVNIAVWDWSKGVFSQEKADGMYANVDHHLNGEVCISSRQGSQFPLDPFAALVDEVRSTFDAGTQMHGELLVMKNGKILPREIGNGILNSVLKGGTFAPDETPIYKVWDQIPLCAVKPKAAYTKPYGTRLMSIGKQLKAAYPGNLITLIETRVVYSLEEAYTHYRELLAKGKEGTIIKLSSAIWKDGTSKDQVKLKLNVDVDLEVVGFVPGEGKNAATFGSLICHTSDKHLEVCVSGFTDAMRQKIHDSRDDHLGKIVTVKANGIMNPSNDDKLHSLFLPRFVEFRNDKSQADSLQRVRDQFESAIRGAA